MKHFVCLCSWFIESAASLYVCMGEEEEEEEEKNHTHNLCMKLLQIN